ncbi:Probable polyketide biosynthesis enoyl-CoA hydratase pksH [Urinicoccus massiliensis]|uniref:3-hydroxyisobutyryl-CoA hydrolase n=1 Tax=Urinicoccus massiliensis TaxID=1723382 RepID=A0A8H2R1U8_9FIRM|nr:enoyl-CoA hydratase/isomerase family protein [Urinicoccus massiliensis]VFB16963.1 Probable polyketide biosynthesis enoyl-CoA hydratase pksH [Urinicoccus massiliensis]
MLELKIEKNFAHISLDRPNKLNALNRDLIEAIDQCMDQVLENDRVKAVYLDSTSPRAFCAGGDVVDIYKKVQATGEDPIPYFEREFRLDKKMAKFPKPILVAYRGIAMGGGLGLSMDCPIRIADESTRMAMPEARLGMVPDVGMGYFFSKMDRAMALYMSLTGSQINGRDALNLGWASHTISSNSWENFEGDLFDLDLEGLSREEVLRKIQDLLGDYQKDLAPLHSPQDLEKIQDLFGAKTLKEIMERVKDRDGALYQDLEEASLLSLALIYLKYDYGKYWTREETLDMDLKVIDYCFKEGDMVEGIRTVMVDKEDQPSFKYQDLEGLPWEDLHRLLGGK